MSLAKLGDKHHQYGKSPKEDTKKKISDTLINNIQRYDHLENKLPKYVKFIDWKDRQGYAIVSHPKCKIKYFVSNNKRLDELFNKCIAHLSLIKKATPLVLSIMFGLYFMPYNIQMQVMNMSDYCLAFVHNIFS